MQFVRNLSLCVMCFSSASTLATDRIYTLVPYTFDDPRYGLSGTITTDGSTGFFADLSFIKDWSITVRTPFEVDGIATEVFTPATGSAFHVEVFSPNIPGQFISVSHSSIAIPPVFSFVFGTVDFISNPDDLISWYQPHLVQHPFHPHPSIAYGGVVIRDFDESPSFGLHRFLNWISGVPIAEGGVAVPEPDTLVLFVGFSALLGWRCIAPRRRGGALQITTVLFPLVAFAGEAPAADRIYTLVSYTFDDPRFGFSGTITTNGSTGDFSNVSFIKDWSITVHTPSDIDGVSTEVFTPTAGLSFNIFGLGGGCDCFNVSETSIVLQRASPIAYGISLGIGDAGLGSTEILWHGPNSVPLGIGYAFLPSAVAIFDPSEFPDVQFQIIGTSPISIATRGVAVPEPSTLVLTSSILGALVAMRRFRHDLLIAPALVILAALAASAQADIYQWEYINPGDPSQGKQQSTTLAPDGAGVDAVPGADLYNRNLTMAYLVDADLTNAYAFGATLTDADFTSAAVRGASFGKNPSVGTGITLAQLYSTASYQTHDLPGIELGGNDLSGANFTGQNLTNAYFGDATLTGAHLSQANLTNAYFGSASLSDADFTGADVRGADFGGTGITLAQLYLTASYQLHDMSGIILYGNNLAGGNFAGQNLANSDFTAADLMGADLREANLANASFGFCVFGCNYAALTDADLTAADARGAFGLNFWKATTANLIFPDGNVTGLDLDAGGLLIVRDDDPGALVLRSFLPHFAPDIPPISITIDEHLSMGSGGTLRMMFEADAWDSTISFSPGIPVTLGGTLELTFAADVNLASQLGRTFDVFDWTGVTPTGAFAVSSPYEWDTSNLYTTGEITLTAIPEPEPLVLLLFFAIGSVVVPLRRPGKKRF